MIAKEIDKKLGLIAQEVSKVIPEAAFTNSNTGYMGVHDNHIMVVMIKAIQEQNNIIDKQKEEIIVVKNWKITIEFKPRFKNNAIDIRKI